jgi:hypothetical protein
MNIASQKTDGDIELAKDNMREFLKQLGADGVIIDEWEKYGELRCSLGETVVTATERGIHVSIGEPGDMEKLRNGDILGIAPVRALIRLSGIRKPLVVVSSESFVKNYDIIEDTDVVSDIIVNGSFSSLSLSHTSLQRGHGEVFESAGISGKHYYSDMPEKYGDFEIIVSYAEAVEILRQTYGEEIGRLESWDPDWLNSASIALAYGSGGESLGDVKSEYFYPCYRFFFDTDNIFYVPAIDLSLLPAV